ncbi:MAG TPA: GNAT family N-acetyltransferase [Ramlibacter sp.]|nr:GNAT family N-acetyltransferase [Ramlibacter sp.]
MNANQPDRSLDQVVTRTSFASDVCVDSVKIRLATLHDLSAMVAIYNEAVRQRFATGDLEDVTLEQRLEWFHEHDPAVFPIYVAESHAMVVGWCSLSAHRPGRAAFRRTAEISYYVRAAFRGRGVGTMLVHHAVDEAPQLGKHVLFGILLEKNIASVNLMKKCGFELWGRLPDVASIDGELVSHLYYGRKL